MDLLDRLPPVSPVTYRRITLATLTSLVFITVTGGAVRLTGSGLGCSTWPSCEPGSFAPRSASDLAGVIEFGNRLVTGLVGVFTLAAVYGALRLAPRRRDLVSWAWQVFAWVVLNAVVGAVVVEHHLLPGTVMVHFLLAMAAIWSGVVLHHRAARVADDPGAGPADPVGPAAPPPGSPVGGPGVPAGLRRAGHALLAAAMATIVLGTVVTGSGPHAGDEDAERLSLDVGEVARIHGVVAVAFLVLTIAVLRMAQKQHAPRIDDDLRWLTFAVLAQGAIGYVQYFSGVPPLLVGAHILGASLVWIAVLRVWLDLASVDAGRASLPRATGGSIPAARARDTGLDAWSRSPG